MENVICLSGAGIAMRACRDCGLTRAAPEQERSRDPILALRVTHPCERCGAQVETPAPRAGMSATGYQYICDECGTPDDLVVARITLPDDLGIGYIHLCPDCIAAYDEPGFDGASVP